MNIDYRQFYRGTTNIPLYGSGAYKKDTLVKYEFNTTDEHGNKIMDKMSKEETLQAMKDIRSQYGDSVIVEFSGDGLAALAEDRKDSMSPEDREAMEAMESIAKLASAGKADPSGNMDYGMAQGRYLGHGSGLVRTTSALDMMRTMDKDAYAEYQKMGKNDDGGLSSLKYLTNWYAGAVKKNPLMVDNYEKQSDEYVEKNVKNQKLDKTFAGLKTGSKAAFFESLKMFQSNNPNFLSSIVNRELTSKFWGF